MPTVLSALRRALQPLLRALPPWALVVALVGVSAAAALGAATKKLREDDDPAAADRVYLVVYCYTCIALVTVALVVFVALGGGYVPLGALLGALLSMPGAFCSVAVNKALLAADGARLDQLELDDDGGGAARRRMLFLHGGAALAMAAVALMVPVTAPTR